jgi:hypothetical protein
VRLFILTTLFVTLFVTILLPRCRYGSPIASTAVKEAQPIFVSADPQNIYSADANDSWNRIFHLLFTRTVKTRMTSEFPEGQPFTPARRFGMAPSVRVSTRTFDRFEMGDRAIEPLYPSFFIADGVRHILTEPNFSKLKAALTDANAETNIRPAIARALMQSDVWAAFDLLAPFAKWGNAGKQAEELLPLSAKLVKKLALTDQEIASLPQTYEQARAAFNLPDLFSRNSSWVEIEMFPERLHDHAADFRRAARVFIHPAATADKQTILARLRTEVNPMSQLDGLVLIMQDLVIDNRGVILPSPIIRDVQIRKFTTDANGRLATSEIQEFELSRRNLLTGSTSGGMISYSEKSPAYLADAGNDYTFASAIRSDDRQDRSTAVLTTLRGRCESCHGLMVNALFTLSTHEALPRPVIARLESSANERALHVAGRKKERDDFRALLRQ